jgi:hypothetical protein
VIGTNASPFTGRSSLYKAKYDTRMCNNQLPSEMAPVPEGYSKGHEEYEGRQRGANEVSDPHVPVHSARTICTRRNIDGGRRAEHAYGPDLEVGVVVVARRANHIIVVADT